MNRLSKILIIPLLIVMVFAFGMGAFAEIHSKWVAGDLIFFDGTTNIFSIRDDTDGVKIYDDLNLTFGTDNDATIKYDEDSTDKLLITCSNGFTVSGAWAVTVAAPTTAVNALYGYITASEAWATDGNLVGVRGKVVISAAGNTGDATGVWAGLEITSASVQRFGLQVGLNVEAYSNTICLPNAVLYIQSLPSGTNTDFSDVPYLVFSETITGGATGSNILFEVGHSWANTIPTKTSGTLFYEDTLQIAVNITAGNRTAYYIPLSTTQGTYTTIYPVDITVASGTALDIGTSVIGIDFTGTYSTAAIQIGTVGRITFYDADVNIYAADDGDMVINADATLIMTSPLTEIVATTSLIHRFDSGDYVTYTIADDGAAKVEVTGQVSGTYEIETSHGAILLDAAATITLDAGTGDIETADVFNSTSAIASTSTASGSIQTDGGVGIVGDVFIGGFINVNASAAETLLDFVLETEWTSGTLIRADFAGGPTTLLGAVTGFALDLGANVDAASEQNVIGIDLNLPQLTISNNTVDVIGIEITAQGAMALTVGGDATWVGVSITTPTISESVGTVDARGINVVGGTLTSGTAYGATFSGEFTTGIDMTGTYSTAAINIATISDGVIATISSAASATNAFYGRIVADAEWSGNLVGVRGKVEIGSIVDITSATGVWAGIAITGPSIQRHGLVCAINAEVSSTTVNMPNAILYLQSLPSGAAADFSNVPYITFSEYISAGTGTNILFEVGSKYSNLMPTKTEGTLYWENTLQIAVNLSAGVRTPKYMPLLTAQVDINDPSSKYVIYVNKLTDCAVSDQNGTFHRPYDEIQDAVLKVVANQDNTDAQAYTIMVAPGTYTTKIDLDSTYLYNLSIMATGAPHSVIVNVTDTGNAFECDGNNANLKHLYVKGIDFYDPISFLGVDDDTEFLRYQCVFEDCLLSWGGTDDPHTEGKTMLTVINAGRFFWHGGSIHVLDAIVITNVLTSGIRGESYRGRFAGVGMPGTTTISNLNQNEPIDFASGTMTYYIIGAYVQRWEPSLVPTNGVVRYWLRNAYSGLGMGLTIPDDGHFYMHNSVQPGNVTLVAGCAVKLYKSHIRGTLTGTCSDITNYGSTKGVGNTAAEL